MTAQTVREHDALAGAPDPVDAARERIATAALRPGSAHRVGLELELHLVELAGKSYGSVSARFEINLDAATD